VILPLGAGEQPGGVQSAAGPSPRILLLPGQREPLEGHHQRPSESEGVDPLEARQYANLTDVLVTVGEAEMDRALASVPAGVGLLEPRAVGMGESLVEEDLTDSRGFERPPRPVLHPCSWPKSS
jgi:hypothetical protein